MPSKTPKMARTMAAAAHNPGFARKVGIPTSVAKDFNKADTGGPMLAKSRPGRPKKQPAPPPFAKSPVAGSAPAGPAMAPSLTPGASLPGPLGAPAGPPMPPPRVQARMPPRRLALPPKLY